MLVIIGKNFFLLCCIFTNWFALATEDFVQEEEITVPNSTQSEQCVIDDDVLVAKRILEKLDSIELLLHEIKNQNNSEQILQPSDTLGTEELSVDHNLFDSTKQHEEYVLAYGMIQSKKYLDAELAFAQFIERYPESELLGQAFFWYAESFYGRKIFNKALSLYLKSYKHFPNSPKAADALLRASLVLGEMNKMREACRLLNRLDEKFPNRSSQSLEITSQARKKFFCDVKQ